MSPLPTFTDARERSIWVQAQLRLVGSSFAAIARLHGWSRRAVANAMLNASNPQEQAIADMLGLSQRELFPERYDRAGKRLHHVRQNTAPRVTGNVKHDEAA
ncbi:MAG TPA: helix-turn-helix domain-containing protein [Aliidongia sp.]|nr:helix-turn-helix domain-containing protein [Aliidongia sp.]